MLDIYHSHTKEDVVIWTLDGKTCQAIIELMYKAPLFENPVITKAITDMLSNCSDCPHNGCTNKHCSSYSN